MRVCHEQQRRAEAAAFLDLDGMEDFTLRGEGRISCSMVMFSGFFRRLLHEYHDLRIYGRLCAYVPFGGYHHRSRGELSRSAFSGGVSLTGSSTATCISTTKAGAEYPASHFRSSSTLCAASPHSMPGTNGCEIKRFRQEQLPERRRAGFSIGLTGKAGEYLGVGPRPPSVSPVWLSTAPRACGSRI